MSLPLYEQGLRRGYARDIADPDCARRVGVCFELLRREALPDWLTGFLFQRHDGVTTQYEAYAMSILMEWMSARWVRLASVYVGVGPSADRMVDENNAKLDRLRRPFRARFRPELRVGSCDDGWFSWSRPISIGDHAQPPSRVPLEVGATAAGRTLLHLREDGGLARWAYGSEHVVVAVVTPEGRSAIGCLALIQIDPQEHCERSVCDDRNPAMCSDGWGNGRALCSCPCHAARSGGAR